jgi:thiamine transport system substrate-binding protein
MKPWWIRTVTFFAAVALIASACGDDDAVGTTVSMPPDTSVTPLTTDSAATTAVPPVASVTLLTHDSFFVPTETLEAFTAETGITVEVVQGGDAGAVVSQAILTAGQPTADVLFGIDNTFLSRGLDAELFTPYASAALADVPDELELDPEHRVTPIDFGDVCLNYDRDAFGGDLAPPASLRDLTDPAYRGMLVVQNPATSSPGLAFLLATIATFGEEGAYPWQAFWRDLAANDVLIVSGWEEAYNAEFSGGSGTGDRPLVVSYASSPPAEVIFADPPPDEAPTAVVVDSCFRQIEFAGILAGSDAGEAAERLIDFMLSPTFQNEVPLNMFVFPANERAVLPDEFTAHTTVPDDPLQLDPSLIDAGRERWLDEWTELLR